MFSSYCASFPLHKNWYTVDALLLTAATILFGHFFRCILLSKLKMVTNSAVTIQERLLITHLRYTELRTVYKVSLWKRSCFHVLHFQPISQNFHVFSDFLLISLNWNFFFLTSLSLVSKKGLMYSTGANYGIIGN